MGISVGLGYNFDAPNGRNYISDSCNSDSDFNSSNHKCGILLFFYQETGSKKDVLYGKGCNWDCHSNSSLRNLGPLRAIVSFHWILSDVSWDSYPNNNRNHLF